MPSQIMYNLHVFYEKYTAVFTHERTEKQKPRITINGNKFYCNGENKREPEIQKVTDLKHGKFGEATNVKW